jgi:transcriptional regulator with XRE-family HTH domain
MTLAQRVRDQRYARGWGPDELASRASISRTALYQIESGRTEQPRAATLRRIAQAFEIPTESLLGPQLAIVAMAPAASTHGHVSEDRFDSTVRLRLDDPKPTVWPGDLSRKFREVLDSPLGEGVARIVEEAYRILPQASDLRR